MAVKYPHWKRMEDIIGATFGLVLVSPLLPFIALAIKIENFNYPILVKLPRVSEGKVIFIYKFNNMILGAEKMKESLMHLNERKDGPFFKIKNDPRVTRVGRVLRKFRLDEIPQLINVLRGELALVGPRPHEPKEVDAYPEEYKLIKDFRAGATGLSQVNGASSLPFLTELQLDKGYIENLSLGNDIKILLKSAAIMLFDPNAV